MKRIVTIILLFIGVCGIAEAQSFGGRSIGSQLRGTRAQEQSASGLLTAAPIKRTYIENRNLRTSDRWTADTVCYKNVERINGWLKGVGPKLTKKQIATGQPYYKLTRRSQAGNYLRVEAVGMASAPDEMRNELFKNLEGYDYAEDAVREAHNMQQTEDAIRRIDFTPSADGTMVLMEKAYDSEGALCRSMTLERIDDRQAVAFYYSPLLGELVLADTDKYTAPTGLIFEYTADGKVAKLTPIDATGWPISKK
ncbi:MAG: hypothetical protein K2L96_08075 [Muribaculaceae bacterium]|nr:hypothetical protein [Muribaculaceae bacterium]